METILAFALNLKSKLTRLGGVLEESSRRLGGVSEPSLGVFEGSEACVRSSKCMLGKASQRFSDQTGDVLGVLKTPPPGVILFFGSHHRNQTQTRHPEG